MSFRQWTIIEFLVVDLKDSLVSADDNHKDNNVLPSLVFSRITRVKVFGDSSLLLITDDDLITILRAATSLQEIHITNSTSITIKGLAALVSASRTSLKLLEYKPLRLGLHTPFLRRTSSTIPHLCTIVFMSQTLAITRPTACPELFSDHSVA